MRFGHYALRLEKRLAPTGLEAAIISVSAVVFALAFFCLIFILDGVNPLVAYREIFDYAFVNEFGLTLTVNRFIFLSLCTAAFIIPFRAGLWNIGMTGQLYTGALAAFAIVYAFGGKEYQAELAPGIVIPLMVVAAALGGAAVGAIAGFLKGRLDVNEIVVTMMLNFILFWMVAFMIKEGGLFMNPGGRGESFELPPSVYAPLILDTPYTIFFALGAAVLLYFMFARTRLGYEIKAHGHNPSAAAYAGISTFRISLLSFLMGGALAGLAGYHYFTAVPGVYKIARTYSFLGDLAFYGLICGLISLGNALTALPIALLFAGLSVGGRFVQGKLQMGFGLDYALLGVLMITLVAFQFFYRNKVIWARTEDK
jgi:simple sugar transport system permease protein